MNSGKFFLLLLLTFQVNLFAQNYELVWKNIESREFVSAQANDTFRVYIKLPDNYSDTEQYYPVLYLLDGDITFPLALSTLQYLEYGRHVPEMIVVGIGYGSLDWRTGNDRSRDYTVFSTPERPYQGGAEKFQAFLEHELLPDIESEYRISKANRIVMGHSLGGQFVLYSFLNNPGLFSGFIASSPAIVNVKDYMLDRVQNNKKLLENSGYSLFISLGGNESKTDYQAPVNELVKKIMAAAGNKKKITFRIFSDEDHFTVPAQALIHGLISIVNSDEWKNVEQE